MTRIVLTFAAEARALYYGAQALQQLRDLGEVTLNEGREPWSGAELVRHAQGAQIIVSDRATAGGAEIFAGLPDLRAFVHCAVDIRNIDLDSASRHGVLVTHASAGFMDAVSELIVAYMIDLARGISASATAYRRGERAVPQMGRHLRGSTLGIVGYGAIGRRLSELALALGMNVLVTDPFVEVDDTRLKQIEFDALLENSDFVVCLAVANESTENLMNAAAFARMRKSAFFINGARGNLVDEKALEEALNAGRIAGAAMDVGRAEDQMPSPTLARHPHVIATPHIGGLTPEAVSHQALETASQVKDILQGRVPVGAVNLASATRLTLRQR